MRARVLAGLLALSLIAVLPGCVDRPSEQTETYRVQGAFTENGTHEDAEAIEANLSTYGADVLVLESFPLQYIVKGFVEEACDGVRAELEAHPRVATVGECQLDAQAEEGDEPVSNSAQ